MCACVQEAEEARRTLLELQAVAAAVESSGQAKAEAQARAERLLIEGQSAIERETSTDTHNVPFGVCISIHVHVGCVVNYCHRAV